MDREIGGVLRIAPPRPGPPFSPHAPLWPFGRIHHEEARGSFDFSGRRDVRRFLETARDVGLDVLLRIGPWDHGECRNGGHPDWVLEEASGGCRRRATQSMPRVRVPTQSAARDRSRAPRAPISVCGRASSPLAAAGQRWQRRWS